MLVQAVAKAISPPGASVVVQKQNHVGRSTPPTAVSSAPNRPACANRYSALLIRNADVQGDEMGEFAYTTDT
jgi:hypothetical protein